MATSGKKEVTVTGNHTLVFEWSLSSQNEANNTSTVYWELYVETDAYGGISLGGEQNWSVTVDGQTTNGTDSGGFNASSIKMLGSGYKTIYHNSDGTKTFSYSFSKKFDFTWGGTYRGTYSGSGSGQLPAISVAPSYSASVLTAATDTNLGGYCRVTFTPDATTLYYKVTFKIGNKAQETTGIYPNTTGTYNYQILLPQSLATEIGGNSKTASCTVELTTHTAASCTSANQVGSKSTRTITVTVVEDSETRPVVSSATLQPSPDLLGGLYIQSANGVKATAISATGKYNATISRTYLRVEGKNYDLNSQSDYLAASGSITVTAYAVDSRGFTSAGLSITIQSQPYSKPKLRPVAGQSKVAVVRCDESGADNDSGAYLKVLVKREFSKISVDGSQKNFCKVSFRYKTAVGSAWSDFTVIISEDAPSDEVITSPLIGTLDPKSSYQVEIVAEDTVGGSGRSVIDVSSEDIYWHRDGARGSLGFGKYVEEDNVLDIAPSKTLIIRGGLVFSGESAMIILNLTHPIGSVLETADMDDPGTYLGGTWTKIEDTGTTIKWKRTD